MSLEGWVVVNLVEKGGEEVFLKGRDTEQRDDGMNLHSLRKDTYYSTHRSSCSQLQDLQVYHRPCLIPATQKDVIQKAPAYWLVNTTFQKSIELLT